MDERMMNLFSLIADQVRDKQELFDNEGTIMQSLLNNGFRIHEADAALTLMQNLVQQESDGYFVPTTPALRTRAMNREERDRFTIDAFGFVAKLTHLGIISEEQREELLEKALSVYTERIELDHIKTLIAFTLFTGQYEGERTTPGLFRRLKRTAWN